MELSKRLRMNASFVTPGNRLADVGTDHGYIPIALCLEGVIPSALAMDVNPGPLERAKEHIQQFDLETDMPRGGGFCPDCRNGRGTDSEDSGSR